MRFKKAKKNEIVPPCPFGVPQGNVRDFDLTNTSLIVKCRTITSEIEEMARFDEPP
jgi:hypothetical protein